MSARATASICCSPPESVPPDCDRRSLRMGKSEKHLSMSSSSRAVSLRANAPMWRFSSTVKRGKIFRPSGAWLIPSRTISCAGRLVMSSPANSIVPARTRLMPGDAHEHRGLPRAVRADHGDDLAAADLERDPLQHLDGAVAGVYIIEGEELFHHPPQSAPIRPQRDTTSNNRSTPSPLFRDTPRSRAGSRAPRRASPRRS